MAAEPIIFAANSYRSAAKTNIRGLALMGKVYADATSAVAGVLKDGMVVMSEDGRVLKRTPSIKPP